MEPEQTQAQEIVDVYPHLMVGDYMPELDNSFDLNWNI